MNDKSNKRIKIGFLSEFSPTDRKASSGTNFKMAEHLSQIGELKWIPIKRNKTGRIVELIIKGVSRIFGKQFEIKSTMWGSKNGFSPIDPHEFDDVDIVAAFFCSPTLAHLKTYKPIVYFTDAAYPSMVNYYWYDRWDFHNRQGTELERLAMENATNIVVSSRWCKDSAVNDLNISPDKIHIVEFGANIDDRDVTFSTPKKYCKGDMLEILFLGVNWERKGGDIAIETVHWLNSHGVPAHLNIVGIRNLPEHYSNDPYVTDHGFLNKNIKEDYIRLTDIISKCQIELLPTKAECSAIAFAEAAAYGLPVFTHDTGGVGNYVVNSVNGYRLPLGSTGEDFGKKIKEVLENDHLSLLSASSRKLYESTLNWDTWGHKVRSVLDSLSRGK